MSTRSAPVDPFLLEVLKNAFDTIADEMALVIMRTAYSPIIRDSMDYSTAICDAQGRTLAQGLTTPMHLGSFYDAMRCLLERFRGRIAPGDVFVFNDPYDSAGQHLPDLYIIQPIFVADDLVAWATTIAHHSDVGGIVPGSNSLNATEIVQEGLRLPVCKFMVAGAPNEAVWDIIRLNVRLPDDLLGDLQAQMAACARADRQMRELFERYGAATMIAYFDHLHDYAERLVRAELAEIPDGIYDFTDHIDGFGDHPVPVVFKLQVTVAGAAVSVDWTGSAAQVTFGINSPLPFTKACAYAAIRALMPADVPNCHGFTRPIQVVAPEGSVMNPVYPGPCGARGIAGYRMIDCIFGAMAAAVPQRVAADGSGGSTLPTISGQVAGRAFVFCETFMGTWGAAPTHDGAEGVPHIGANQSNVPVEMIEATYPIRIEAYGMVPDSGGAGAYRGGLSLCREYRMLAADGLLNVRSDKRDFPPHGLFGGAPGAASRNRVERSSGETLHLPTLLAAPIAFRAGDLFHHEMASGGGHGDPLTRDPASVLEDVLDGKVTIAHAAAAYGVIIVGRAVDAPATADRRLAEARKQALLF